jgi:hypothetical protein
MNRQFLYLLLTLIIVVAVSPMLLRTFGTDGFVPPLEGFARTSEGFVHPLGGLSRTSEGFVHPLGGLSRTSEGFVHPLGGLSRTSEGFAPPRVAPFGLESPRPAEPHSILVSDPPIQEAFEGVSSVKPVVAVTDTAYDAMTLKQRSDLLKNVQQIVREEIRAGRTQPLLASPSSSLSSSSSCPSVQQGRDYQHRCDKEESQEEYRCPKNPDGSCPPVPDLTQYIRKDQIPCWGCAIDY